MFEIARRYAAALLRACGDPGRADLTESVLDDLAGAMDSSRELRELMASPHHPLGMKKNTVRKLLSDSTPETAMNFFCLLLDKGHFADISSIAAEFKKQKADSRALLPIKITSAHPLEESQIEKIKLHYMKKYGAASARVQTVVSGQVLGGLRVQVGDMLVDDTLASRLRSLRGVLAGGLTRPDNLDKEVE